MKKEIKAKIHAVAKHLLKAKGFEILEENWSHASDHVDFIARDGDDLVFINMLITRKKEPFGDPRASFDRDAFERIVIAYLTDYDDSSDFTIRADALNFLILDDERTIIRHDSSIASVVSE